MGWNNENYVQLCLFIQFQIAEYSAQGIADIKSFHEIQLKYSASLGNIYVIGIHSPIQ